MVSSLLACTALNILEIVFPTIFFATLSANLETQKERLGELCFSFFEGCPTSFNRLPISAALLLISTPPSRLVFRIFPGFPPGCLLNNLLGLEIKASLCWSPLSDLLARLTDIWNGAQAKRQEKGEKWGKPGEAGKAGAEEKRRQARKSEWNPAGN